MTYLKQNILQYTCNFLFPVAVEKTATTETSENAGMYWVCTWAFELLYRHSSCMKDTNGFLSIAKSLL